VDHRLVRIVNGLTVLDGYEPRFEAIELGGRYDVFIFGRQNRLDLFFYGDNTIARWRVIGKYRGYCSRPHLFLRLQLFKET